MKSKSRAPALLSLVAAGALALAGCSSGSGSGSSSSGGNYTIGGTVSGMSGTGLVLQLNGANDKAISVNGNFSFSAITEGSAYKVTAKTQPTGPDQVCDVMYGSGTVPGANVTDIAITCSPWTKQMGVAGGYADASGVATDASGNIFVVGDTDGGLDGNALTGTRDFFLTKYDALGNKIYTRQMGASGAGTVATSVATDADGNLFVVGFTGGGLDGNVSSGFDDFFLTKHDALGNKVYTRQMGANGGDTFASSVATDTNGNVFVAGATSVGLDGNTKTGTTDFFLTKYDASGNKVYTKQMGVGGVSTIAYGVATDANGNVFVAGYTQGNLDGNTLTGSVDFFLTKYDATGTKVYTKLLGATSATTVARSVAADVNGNIFVTGDTNGNLDGNIATGMSDLFLTKYDALGTKIYTKQLGAAGTFTVSYDVAADANGNIFVTGNTQGNLDGNTLTGTQDLFLTKFDAVGNKLYTKQSGVTGAYLEVTSLATDASGDVFITGYTDGSLDGYMLTGRDDLFLLKYDNKGNKQ